MGPAALLGHAGRLHATALVKRVKAAHYVGRGIVEPSGQAVQPAAACIPMQYTWEEASGLYFRLARFASVLAVFSCTASRHAWQRPLGEAVYATGFTVEDPVWRVPVILLRSEFFFFFSRSRV